MRRSVATLNQSFVLRHARLSELDTVAAFYREQHSERLPAPSTRDLYETLDNGRFLIVEPLDGGVIAACAAIFDFTSHDCPRYVGELSGTRVTRALGGLGPMSFQGLLLRARLAGYVATASEHPEGRSSSLITIVKSDNAPSLQNVESAGFVRLEHRPEWFAYDDLSWHGSIIEDDWQFFLATEATVRDALRSLSELGVFRGQIELSRMNRDSGLSEQFSIRIDLPDIAYAVQDLTDIMDGRRRAGLSDLPESLV